MEPIKTDKDPKIPPNSGNKSKPKQTEVKKRKRGKREVLPISTVKSLLKSTGMRIRPGVTKMVIKYLVEVTDGLSKEATKLAKENKRATIIEADMEKVLRFKPYCDL